jgi:UDP-3-O-[3-hydroxymyristoyl] glucosamine N-acyltransferase
MIEIKKLAEIHQLSLVGRDDLTIQKATSLDNQTLNSITWVKDETFLKLVKCGVVLMHRQYFKEALPEVTFLLTDESPKLIFSLILKTYFTPEPAYYLKNCVDEHRKNKEVTIAEFVFIGQNVTIGKGTIIFPHVMIEADTQIGENCIIKSNVSLGTEGLGFQLNPSTDLLEKFPQIGNTILEDFVEIGPNSTVRRGALKSTRIGKGTKIGALINIGHNCEVGENCIFTAGIVLSGSSKVGNNVFVGVNASIKNGVQIGNNVEIGMGAVVINPLEDDVKVVGNPAKIIKK